MLTSRVDRFPQASPRHSGPVRLRVRPGKVWRDEASKFAKVSADVAGNSMAEVNPGGSPTIMLDGHIDEIGVIVQYIDDDGYIYIAPIGGWDPQVLVGQRIRFLGADGDVIGVVGKKPIHLMKSEDRDKALEVHRPVGGHRRRESRRGRARLTRRRPGRHRLADARLPERPHRLALGSTTASAPSSCSRRCADTPRSPGPARVVAAATTQEEIAWHGGGARVCAYCINPQMAIVVDVTFATDHPSIEKKEIGEHNIGGGPVLSRGALISPVVFRLLRETAETKQDRVHACMRPAAIPPPMPTRSTSRAKASRPRSCRSRTATCTRRTRWYRSRTWTMPPTLIAEFCRASRGTRTLPRAERAA